MRRISRGTAPVAALITAALTLAPAAIAAQSAPPPLVLPQLHLLPPNGAPEQQLQGLGGCLPALISGPLCAAEEEPQTATVALRTPATVRIRSSEPLTALAVEMPGATVERRDAFLWNVTLPPLGDRALVRFAAAPSSLPGTSWDSGAHLGAPVVVSAATRLRGAVTANVRTHAAGVLATYVTVDGRRRSAVAKRDVDPTALGAQAQRTRVVMTLARAPRPGADLAVVAVVTGASDRQGARPQRATAPVRPAR